MNTAYFSTSCGIVGLPNKDDKGFTFYDVIKNASITQVEARHRSSLVNDWKEYSHNSSHVDEWKLMYWSALASKLLCVQMADPNPNDSEEVLAIINDMLLTHLPVDRFVDAMLILPLRDTDVLQQLKKIANENALMIFAGAIARIEDNQAELRRLHSTYWRIATKDDHLNIDFRERMWEALVLLGMERLLQSSNKHEFIKTSHNAIFDFAEPVERSNGAKILNVLADELFGHKDLSLVSPEEELYPDIIPNTIGKKRSTHEEYHSVRKQIDTIGQLIRKGNDELAHTYIDQLRAQQSSPGNEKYLVKTLCHLASASREEFRADFEFRFLEMAVDTSPNDEWSLIQIADYHKRYGDFARAELLIRRAITINNDPVAVSTLADIYTCQGQYDKAIDLYESLSHTAEELRVQNAIADVHRKQGRMDRAKQLYNNLLLRLTYSSEFEFRVAQRSRIGLAEIEKYTGNLDNAVHIYRDVLHEGLLQGRELVEVQLAYVNVLVRQSKFTPALDVIEGILKNYPYASSARSMKGIVLALSGDNLQALAAIEQPVAHLQSSLQRDWMNSFCLGIVQLKLQKNTEARMNLVDNYYKSIKKGVESNLLRMGAALYLLSVDKNYNEAAQIAQVPDTADRFDNYLTLMVKYHLARVNENVRERSDLLKIMAEDDQSKAFFADVVQALDRRDYSRALIIEANAMLEVAAKHSVEINASVYPLERASGW